MWESVFLFRTALTVLSCRGARLVRAGTAFPGCFEPILGVLVFFPERPLKVLILLAHPAYERSRVNRALCEAIADLVDVHVHDLYEAWPDLHIDVAREQDLLVQHDVIVIQHPFYWYSAPAIVKEWLDLVLEHGWAYGSAGKALHGKVFLNATTTGGQREAYQPQGYNRFTMRAFLAPFEQTACLCGMTYLAPFVVHESLKYRVPQDVQGEAARYRRLVEALRDGHVDLGAASRAEYLDESSILLPEGREGTC